MRKIALLIVLMTIFALTTYAEITLAIVGKEVMTFGVDLNDPIETGFKNETTAELDFTLISGSSEKGKPEDGAVYGWIKLADWSMAADNGVWKSADNGDLTAKIIFPSGWVKISGTNADLNYINVVQDDDADKDNADKGLNDAITNKGGIVLGLNFAPIAIEIGVFSEEDWTGTDENSYGVNAKVTADFTVVKIEGGVEMGLNYLPDPGIGAGAKLTANIAPLTAYAGLDVTVDGAANEMEFGFGASLAVAGITVTADGSYNDSLDGFDVRAKIDAGGLVAGLGLALTVELFNMTGIAGDPTAGPDAKNAYDADADLEYGVIVDLSYATATIKPYASVRYATYTVTDNKYTYTAANAAILALTIGAELYLIPNVTFDAKYTSDNLTETTDKGKILFITKIAL